MNAQAIPRRDEAMLKGAMEDDGGLVGDERRHFCSLLSQLGHRDQDEMLKDNDTDFPEPDARAEITGK